MAYPFTPFTNEWVRPGPDIVKTLSLSGGSRRCTGSTRGFTQVRASRRITALRPALFVLKGVSRTYKAIRLRDRNEVPDLPSTLSSKLTLTLSPEDGEEQ